MKKQILLFTAMIAPVLCMAAQADEAQPKGSELSEASYEIDVVIYKGKQLLSYKSGRLEPMRWGQTSTITIAGVSTPLKYDGMSSSQEANGVITQHTLAYVTENNRFVVDTYRADCGSIKLDTTWPPQRTKYSIEDKALNCELIVKIKLIE